MADEKIPLIAINSMPLEIAYEGPTFVVVDKPAGMAVHPTDEHGTGTLVNGLLQSNRWLAEMETSHTPGVVHVLDSVDRGLVLVAKTDEMAATLRQLYRDRAITFSYRVRIPASQVLDKGAPVTIFDRQVYDETVVVDFDSPLGDTRRLRSEWLGDVDADAYFVLYRMNIPAPGKTVAAALGERIWLPSIDLYTVPPCSVCNGTKEFLTYNGFAYRDHTLTDPANVEIMRQLRGDERGIPVVQFNGQTSVGFDRHRLKTMLGLY